MTQSNQNDIAIIGMAGRFPKAANVKQFWANLVGGVSATHIASAEELAASHFPEELLAHPRFVNASLRLEESDAFDAEFFSFAHSEALLMDPQIRLMLQTCWHAFEDAGYDVSQTKQRVGVFAGMSTNSYLMRMLECDADSVKNNGLQHRILNDKDFLATWISYKLNLHGPAMSIQTACSTSLLAVHTACQSLLNGECEMALAGGVCIDAYQLPGYVHMPGSIYSSDGVCRPFDKNATGTLNADGVGVVLVKRLADALADRDHIYAVIKGSAANNDGAAKLSYTAPSVDFQRDVIAEALAMADVPAESIGMIEAHGTGTALGDPVEVMALTEAFDVPANQPPFCALGSVKANVGHMDTAAGVAGLIKAALCVYHAQLVPNIHFESPNPQLHLEQSPFYVNQDLLTWPDSFAVRRAGISSFGVGGTNVHVVIEQAPALAPLTETSAQRIVVCSAEHPDALEEQKKQLAQRLSQEPAPQLADLEFTQLYGRKSMQHKFVALTHSVAELQQQLLGQQTEGCYAAVSTHTPVIFLFPGQGSQYQGMTATLYQSDAHYRKVMDECLTYIRELDHGTDQSVDFAERLFGTHASQLDQTEHTQLALFITEYCLASYLQQQGIHASAYIGHSLGEYVAACLAGCLSLREAIVLVNHRARLMAAMPKGAMLSVRAGVDMVRPLLLEHVAIAGFNSEKSLVLAGSNHQMIRQQQMLNQAGVENRMLAVSHAFHSPMMEDVLPPFAEMLAKVNFKPAQRQLISTYTGKLAEPHTMAEPQYWLSQLRHPVQFTQAIQQAAAKYPEAIFVEVGPGRALSTLVREQFSGNKVAIPLLGSGAAETELGRLTEAKARLYLSGATFHTSPTHDGRRISLPGYAFQPRHYFKPHAINGKSDRFANLVDLHSLEKLIATSSQQAEKLRTGVTIDLVQPTTLSADILAQLDEAHQHYAAAVAKILKHAHVGELSAEVAVMWRNPDHASDLAHASYDIHTSPNAGQPRSKALFAAPVTPLQQMLAKHWQELLGYQPAGLHDDYFDVGGNSLIAVHLLSRITDELQIELNFSDLANCQTIDRLAKTIEFKQALAGLADDFALDENNDEIFVL